MRPFEKNPKSCLLGTLELAGSKEPGGEESVREQGHLQSLAAFSHCPSVVVTVPQIIIMTRRECKDNLSDVVPPAE